MLLLILFAGKNLIDYEQITLYVMGWLSKIFKGSSHGITDRNYRGNYGDDSDGYAPSTSGVVTFFSFFCIFTCNFQSRCACVAGLM